MKKEIKLDLACGLHKEKGYVGVDIRSLKGVDKVLDLKIYPWPWKDQSVSEIVVNYFLSYLDGPERIKFIDECYRILKVDGKVVIKEPHWNTVRAIGDPLFKWPPIGETTFLVFNKGWRKTNEQEHYPVVSDFDFTYGHSIPSDIVLKNDDYKMFAIRHYSNAVIDILITLTKRGSI